MTLPEGSGLVELEPGALDAAQEITDIGVAEVEGHTSRPHSHRADGGDKSDAGSGGGVR